MHHNAERPDGLARLVDNKGTQFPRFELHGTRLSGKPGEKRGWIWPRASGIGSPHELHCPWREVCGGGGGPNGNLAVASRL